MSLSHFHLNCLFCDDQIGTTNIIFYDFKFTCAFWEDLHYWLFPKFEDLHIFNKGKCIIWFIFER